MIEVNDRDARSTGGYALVQCIPGEGDVLLYITAKDGGVDADLLDAACAGVYLTRDEWKQIKKAVNKAFKEADS